LGLVGGIVEGKIDGGVRVRLLLFFVMAAMAERRKSSLVGDGREEVMPIFN
jgi:hypothetical protein